MVDQSTVRCCLALTATLLAGCAAPGPTPAAPAPESAAGSASAPAPASASASAPAPASASASASAPAPAPAGPRVTVEQPYKLGKRPAPDSDAAREELDRWNRGGRGDPPAPPPPPEGHPLPRVIVDVTGVKGPLRAADAQRVARQRLWGRIVECYRPGAYRDPSLGGKTTVRLTVSRAGKVTAAKSTGSSLRDPEVVACLTTATKSLPLPRAKAGSTVTLVLQVFPGDDPLEPPSGVIRPGDGVLSPDAIGATLAGALPAFRACYEDALRDAPALWGRLAIRFHVTAAGAVDEAFQVESAFPDERVVRCVLRAARGLTFPAPAGGDLRFVAPLRFAPADGPGFSTSAPAPEQGSDQRPL